MQGMRYQSAEVTDITRFINDPLWTMEQKADGIRCIVDIGMTGTVRFLSHTGAPLKSGVRHHAAIAAAVQGLTGVTLDGELLDNGHLWLFDLLTAAGNDIRGLAQFQRRAMLDVIGAHLEGTVVHVLPQAVTAVEKANMWADVLAANAEGVVVKRAAATYATGKARTGDVLKVKVTRTIDVVVIGRNTDGHLNARLGLYDEAGRLVEVGACSMIGKADAQPGDVIEVTFLYVVDPANPALYQCRMMRPRPDKTAVECELWQIADCTVSKAVLA